MFYEKLAQAKQEKKKGLSTGQKIGVGLGGLAGGLAIPSALSHIPALDRAMFETDFSRRADDLASKYTGDASENAASDAYNAVIHKHREAENADKLRRATQRADLENAVKEQARRAGVSAEDIASGTGEYRNFWLNNDTPEIRALSELDAEDLKWWNQRSNTPRLKRLGGDEAQAAYDAVKREHADLASEIPTLRERHKRIMGKKIPLFLVPSILAGGYGTKKLFDRYNQRKQQKD